MVDPLGRQSRGINGFERICLYSWHFQICCRGGSDYPLGASSGHLCPVWWRPSWWQGRSTPSTHLPSTFSDLPCCCQGHFPFFFLHSRLQNLPDLERFVLCRKGWNTPKVWLMHQEHGLDLNALNSLGDCHSVLIEHNFHLSIKSRASM